MGVVARKSAQVEQNKPDRDAIPEVLPSLPKQLLWFPVGTPEGVTNPLIASACSLPLVIQSKRTPGKPLFFFRKNNRYACQAEGGI